MITDITFCVSSLCKMATDCRRHYSNHKLGQLGYISMADFYHDDIQDCRHYESIRLHEQALKVENGKKRRR